MGVCFEMENGVALSWFMGLASDAPSDAAIAPRVS